jgi:hypothetical protein
MRWPSRQHRKAQLIAALQQHSNQVRNLPGITIPAAVDALAMQLVASLRREDYYRAVQAKPVSVQRADPNSPLFDAERAVAYHMQNGNIEEAAWLVFLMTHFARAGDTAWLRLRDVYGRLGAGVWDFTTVKANPTAFFNWLSANWQNIRGKFGNHRKYESLDPNSNRNMAKVLGSYLAWVGPGGHQAKFAQIVHAAGNDPHVIFDAFYQDMSVLSFGRLAKFDYLSLLGRYGIAPISAGSAYLQGATGPARGARLLFDGNAQGPSTTQQLQTMLDDLDADLGVGMAVLEDALCNWQKSPLVFVHYTG